MESFSPPGPLQVPVLITAFSRYDTLREVFLAVRKAKPPRLYFACDGPRNDQERAQCEKVRSLVELVDWKCEVHTLFHDRNKGCKYSMAANITWFFENEEEGIILEDDIVPATSFFWFCQELLARYRNDDRIWTIIGNNLSAEERPASPDSYWFSSHGYGAYWGWASWRRVWEKFDVEMKEWANVGHTRKFKDYYLSKMEAREASKLFEYTYNGRISSTWDYQLDFAKVMAGAMNLIPEVNLCRNIGFAGDGTHTVSGSDSRNREVLHEARFPLVHPEKMEIDPDRDLAYFNAHILPSRFQRIKNSIKDALPPSMEKKVTPVMSSIQRKLGLG